MTERWLILGAGSIGGLWATRLYQAGRPPQLLLREEALADYKGLSIDGKQSIPVPATTAADLTRPIDHLLVCCKSYQTLDALTPLAPHFHEKTSLVLVQNGMGIAEQIKTRYPALRLYCGSTTVGANRTSRFAIRPAGNGETQIGSFDEHAPDADTLADSLSCPGFPVTASRNILALLWRKLAVNCAINPLTVRYRCRNGELLSKPSARADLETICEEFSAVSRALGRESWVPDLRDTVIKVAQKTATNRSSMLQDVEAGRTTEIDAITGYLCREAERLSIPTPANQSLLDEIVSTHSPR